MITAPLVFMVLTVLSGNGEFDSRTSKADQLVRLSLEAELQGDNALRKSGLEEALRVSP